MPTIDGGSSAYDYEAKETLVVSEPEQLRALADDLRAGVVSLLRSRARSTQELARELGIPKGTIGYHLKVLERAAPGPGRHGDVLRPYGAPVPVRRGGHG